ncbi:peptidase [Kineosporia sp. NBRC 101677]|uniref:alpha/beta hydrolase n=1 Tax=Kineosporia sp. NBRC 101677 TaxID=3032197 RepID=UPI0024A400F4|nr:alpha/beta hydrolase [Kineosporia sp. NBRC 101677]GLY15451.1 peptidase [Kineosporia sp. NBRC 101677]
MRFTRAGSLVAALAMAASGTVALAAPSASATTRSTARSVGEPDRTSAAEARRMDRIKTPELDWYSCYAPNLQCATAKVPLDYDQPKGAKTEIALLRSRATEPKKRIGSLFVNPGGPSGSATDVAANAAEFFDPALQERFDIIGVDPRGVGASARVKCFTSNKAQSNGLEGLKAANYYPETKKEQQAMIASAEQLGQKCSTTGKKLAGSMSTVQVARDMELMRRAVGDKKLTYIGFSYGTFLGEVYANLYPDRVRAIAIDGVLDPISWTGTKKTGKLNQDQRLHSAEGADKALRELLVRCGKAGVEACPFAAGGKTVAKFDTLTKRLKKKPVVFPDGSRYDFSNLIDDSLTGLYDVFGVMLLPPLLQSTWEATDPGATKAQRTAATKRLRKSRNATHAAVKPAPGPRRGFPYDNPDEAFSAVTCTDARHPAKASSWPAQARAADKRAQYFGAKWAWTTVQCATQTWTVKDEDAYRGPFTRRTAAPVLVIGNTYDPATNHAEAVSTAQLMPNSRLISSDSWGHTAYNSSACVNEAVSAYLLTGKAPAKNLRCVGDFQPFVTADEPSAQSTLAARPSIVSPPPSVFSPED